MNENDENELISKQYKSAVEWNSKNEIKQSFLFSRMHELKHSFSQLQNTFTKDENLSVLTIILSEYIKVFLANHTNFPEKDGVITLSDIYAMKNEQEYKQYIDKISDIGYILEKVYGAITTYALTYINDNEAICLDLAVKTVVCSKTKDYELIRTMLLKVLQNEKNSGIINLNANREYLTIWILVALQVDFEEWYENIKIVNSDKVYNNDIFNDDRDEKETIKFDNKNIKENVLASEDRIINNHKLEFKSKNSKNNNCIKKSIDSYQNSKIKKKNIVLYLIKKTVSLIFIVFILLIMLMALNSFNIKYGFLNNTKLSNVLIVLNDSVNNALSFTSEKISYLTDLLDSIIAQKEDSRNNDSLYNANTEIIPESASKEQSNIANNRIEIDSTNLESSANIESISKNAVKLVDSIKKIDLSNAIISFNVKQNAWSLKFTDKTMAKNSIYIIDYINPITLEPCCSTYYFDDKGRMLVGWGIDKNENYYYFDDDAYNVGKMCTGWKVIDNNKYYFLDNGRLLIDDYTPDGRYVDKNGILVISDN